MSAITMQIEKRTDVGKNEIKKLRVKNQIPAVIYSRGEETIHASVDNIEFARVYKIAGSTSVINLDLEGKSLPVIIKDIQRHPIKNQILHVDFQKLNMDEKIKITLPIVLLNRDSINLQPSVLMQILDQVEIECLPGDIPNAAEVDVQHMDFTTPIMVKDLDIASDDKVTILRDLEDVVCTLTEPSIAEETDEDDDEDATPVVIGEETESEE